MKRFANVNEALETLHRSGKVINELSRVLKDERSYYPFLGRSVLWHLYNICERALYVCCANDATASGTITFPSLKDLPRFNKIPGMFIPDEVRDAAKKACEYSKPDLENNIDPFELFDAIREIRTILQWICGKTMVDDIRYILEDILRRDIFGMVFAI